MRVGRRLVDCGSQACEVDDVAREGRFGADLFGRCALGDGPVVVSTREQMQCWSDAGAEHRRYFEVGHRGKVADRVNTQARQPFSGDGPDSPEFAYRQCVEEVEFSARRNDHDPIGFGHSRGDLRDLLTAADTDGSRQPDAVEDAPTDLLRERLGVGGGGTDEIDGFAESLVEGQHLDDRHRVTHDPEDLAAHHAVHRAARWQYHRRRSDEASCLMHRHRRMRTESTCGVAGARDDTAAPGATDEHRASREGRSRQLLHRGEEGIHVQMHHPPGAAFPV